MTLAESCCCRRGARYKAILGRAIPYAMLATASSSILARLSNTRSAHIALTCRGWGRRAGGFFFFVGKFDQLTDLLFLRLALRDGYCLIFVFRHREPDACGTIVPWLPCSAVLCLVRLFDRLHYLQRSVSIFSVDSHRRWLAVYGTRKEEPGTPTPGQRFRPDPGAVRFVVLCA